jgi:hypothetical protein
MHIHDHALRMLISILMESPMYMTLSLSERRSLLERLTSSYPHFDDEKQEGQENDIE